MLRKESDNYGRVVNCLLILKVCPYTHTRNTTAETTGFSFLFEAFRKISDKLLANHEVNISLQGPHMTNTDITKLVQEYH